jgi:halogenation protein CepH
MYGTVRVLRDFSYRNDRYYHQGGVLIGDSACFIDPVFSSGVHLATFAGLLAARSVNTALSGAIPEQRCFEEFELRYRREFGIFYQFLMSFYDMHEEPESYFWSARKILRASTDGREAFVGLVAGLGTVDPRFESVDTFLETAADEAQVLRRVTEAKADAGVDPELANEMRKHTESLFRERRALLDGGRDPSYARGLMTSEDELRWELPSGRNSEPEL